MFIFKHKNIWILVIDILYKFYVHAVLKVGA